MFKCRTLRTAGGEGGITLSLPNVTFASKIIKCRSSDASNFHYVPVFFWCAIFLFVAQNEPPAGGQPTGGTFCATVNIVEHKVNKLTFGYTANFQEMVQKIKC